MALDAALEALRGREGIDGKLNYLISAIINDIYPRDYMSLNAAIGVLECCKLELYRRVLTPYEEQKRFDNGDVYS